MRHEPANRRATETFEFDFRQTKYTVTFGRFPNGNISEIFVDAGKPGSELHNLGQDLGIVISIMLQHGILISDLEGSLIRLDDGTPAGPLGELIRRMRDIW